MAPAVVPEEQGGYDIIGECAGQHFQVSRLLLHLSSALGPASDVLLDPYLLCWEELIKYDISTAGIILRMHVSKPVFGAKKKGYQKTHFNALYLTKMMLL